MEEFEEKSLKPKHTFKQVISVLSLYNTTIKDTFAANMAYLLSKKTEEKVLLIDFECPFPTLDHYFNTDKFIYLNELHSTERLTGVSGCLSGMQKGIFDSETFCEYVKEVYGCKNLYLLSGLFDINLFEDFELNHVEEIIKAAKQNFSTIIISLNSFIYNVFTYASILNSDKVILVSEPTMTNGRANLSLINQYTNVQKVPIKRFSILLWGNMMDAEMQNRLYEGYEVLGQLQSDKRYMEALFHKKLLLKMPNMQKEIRSYLKIANSLGYVPKEGKLKQFLHNMKNFDPYEDD